MINVNNFFSNNSVHSKDAAGPDYAGVIAGVKACSEVNGNSCVLVDFDKHEPIFLSEYLIYLDEATSGDYKRKCINPYWALVSDETLETLSLVQKDYDSLKLMMSKEDYHNHLCVMDYPISIRGRAFFINCRFTPIFIGDDTKIKLGLFSFVPSSKKEVSLLVIVPSGKRWAYDFASRNFKEFNLEIKLSQTEKAILHRAMKGMSNEEIANDLFLSLNTIKSHKLHIFKKLNVTSISEALIVIGNYKLL